MNRMHRIWKHRKLLRMSHTTPDVVGLARWRARLRYATFSTLPLQAVRTRSDVIPALGPGGLSAAQACAPDESRDAQ